MKMDDGLMMDYYKNCSLCPRNCGVNRFEATGVCGSSAQVTAARAGLHYYEEPFLSGTRGSGTIFFTGCSLGCIYCQNYQISQEGQGFSISKERLAEIILEQQARGAHNINLVTGTHFTPSIAWALQEAKEKGLMIPVVWNSSGYEKPETLRMLQGLVDIFLPDFKTMSSELGKRYMHAPDYPERAKEALACMVEMVPDAEFYRNVQPEYPLQSGTSGNSINDGMHRESGLECPVQSDLFRESINARMRTESESEYAGEQGLMKCGVVVRHMMVPGQGKDSRSVLRYLWETYGDRIWISLMSQYTPVGAFAASAGSSSDVSPDSPVSPSELYRTVSRKEYDRLVDYAISFGIENCMIQEGETASDSFIPEFDGSGIINSLK